MSVGFGFSVGDFIAALELVATVVDALRESGEASKRYRELVRQLDSLETILLRVKRLELDESQHAEYVALQQAASQCQRTIDEFWNKIKKYQPALGLSGKSSRLKSGWMKIRWAVCKKEDINAFKSDVAAHTESIQLLLTTIHMSRVSLLERKDEQRRLSLAGQIQAAYFGCMRKLSAVFEATSAFVRPYLRLVGELTWCRGIEQGKQLISMTSKIMQMNIQVFQVVLNIQNFITHIPAQVERQQPVYLIDALGRQSPFHLEFIRSAEAFTAVLQANFSKTGQARQKIGRGEFVIQNSLTKRDINIFDDWEKCFYPGQRVEMSVVFQRRWQTGSSCPGCGMVCDGSTEANVECTNCEMIFRRIIEIDEDKSLKIQSHQRPYDKPDLKEEPAGACEVIRSFPLTENISQTVPEFPSLVLKEEPAAAYEVIRSFPVTENISQTLPVFPTLVQKEMRQLAVPRLKRKREYARDDELEIDLHLENIRRVRIQTVSRGYTEKFKAMFAYFEEGGKPEPVICFGFRTKEDDSCLIIDFEDGENSALCDTIGHQSFKLGGLFQTELVAAESIVEDAEEMSRQITWMEEDEVQIYLRFKSKSDRDIIWKFILAAQMVWQMRDGRLVSTHLVAPTGMNVSSGNRPSSPRGLVEHEQTKSRPWKCPVESCKYHEYGWPTTKELQRHQNDKHPIAPPPPIYECLFKPCPYRSKRESNCKQHMEKAHGWTYIRSKNNGKNRGKSVLDLPTPETNENRSASPNANVFELDASSTYGFNPGCYFSPLQGDRNEYNADADFSLFQGNMNEYNAGGDFPLFQGDMNQSLTLGTDENFQTREEYDNTLFGTDYCAPSRMAMETFSYDFFPQEMEPEETPAQAFLRPISAQNNYSYQPLQDAQSAHSSSIGLDLKPDRLVSELESMETDVSTDTLEQRRSLNTLAARKSRTKKIKEYRAQEGQIPK